MLLSGCGGDGRTRVCFGSDEFCERAFASNADPVADAGPGLEVNAGARVRLDGSGSRDPDGDIVSFVWAQESGPPVALAGATTATAEFLAPEVDTVTDLRFRLLVRDDDDGGDEDSVTVTVAPQQEAVALARGLAVLKALDLSLLPSLEDTAGDDTAGALDPASLGLWLGARVSAARGGWDPELDVLLDELRVVQIHLDGFDGADAAHPLFALGQRDVAAFTRLRDPATAERAAAELTTTSTHAVQPAVWLETIAAHRTRFAAAETCNDPFMWRTMALQVLTSELDHAAIGDVAAASLILMTTKRAGRRQPAGSSGREA